MEIREADFNPDFVKRLIPKIDWAALIITARQVRLKVRATQSRGG